MYSSGSSVPAVNRGYSKANDNVSHVLMGTKMVERVINMQKLAPPRTDDNKGSPHGSLSAKSSSPYSAGFGRSLSRRSLDMAIRHMDIRRTIPGNLRPLLTNILASSMYSVRSGHTRGRPMNVMDSPLATSSNASSEISVCYNNGICLEASEKEDDAGSERGCRSLQAYKEDDIPPKKKHICITLTFVNLFVFIIIVCFFFSHEFDDDDM